MNVNVLVLGNLDTNCYIIDDGKNALIIDPADDFKKICNYVKDFNVVEILVTHHHFDHIGALKKLENKYGLKHNSFNSSIFSYEVIKTPGHTFDSLSFYFKNINSLFVGDFIFKDGIGRCDFPESSILDMFRSLKMISKYPDDIKIYPGHGDSTLLGKEKENFE